ncbi:protein Red [Nephila pilipes]|uniref:Protein Red n=1 Tax=Nephila pilipes TaxID=299642 RepID=A0A8X6N1F6_NEPPI|nr:protein Red [Nephila pilipes]
MNIDDRVYGHVPASRVVSKNLVSDLLLSTAAYEALRENVRIYKDKAKERRDGVNNPDYQNEDPIISAAGYLAVAPDSKSGLYSAERRSQMFQESEYLGGDIEPSHLVKFLDYVPLQKCIVKSITKTKRINS